METDYADAFSYPIFWDYYSGMFVHGLAIFSIAFVDLRLDFERFLRRAGLLQRYCIKYKGRQIPTLILNYKRVFHQKSARFIQ
jgi:hypothetical protein